MLRAGKLLNNFTTGNQAFKRGLYGATRPRVRISLVEKLTHGFIFTVGILAIPTYISLNLKNYRGN